MLFLPPKCQTYINNWGCFYWHLFFFFWSYCQVEDERLFRKIAKSQPSPLLSPRRSYRKIPLPLLQSKWKILMIRYWEQCLFELSNFLVQNGITVNQKENGGTSYIIGLKLLTAKELPLKKMIFKELHHCNHCIQQSAWLSFWRRGPWVWNEQKKYYPQCKVQQKSAQLKEKRKTAFEMFVQGF